MANTSVVYFPWTTDQDDAWGTDIRKQCFPRENANGSNNSSIVVFTDPNALSTITVDPANTVTTTTTDNRTTHGWAINQGGTDGMQSTATAKRIIAAGDWYHQGFTILPQPAVGGSYTVQIEVSVYRVGASASYTRSLLFSCLSPVYNSPALATQTTWNANATAVAAITLEAGETLHWGYRIISKASKDILNVVTNTSLTFYLGVGVGTAGASVETAVTMPGTYVNTRFFKSFAGALSFLVNVDIATILGPKTAALSLTGSSARLITAARSFAVALSPVVAIERRMTPNPKVAALTLAAAISKRITPNAKVAALTLLAAVSKLAIPGPKTAALTLTGVATRRITAFQAFTTGLTLTASNARVTVRFRAHMTALTLAAVASRAIAAARTFTTALSPGASVSRRTSPNPKVSVLSLTAAMTRQISAARAFIATLSLTAVMARVLLAFRAFTTGLSLSSVMSRVVMAARIFTTALSIMTATSKKMILSPKIATSNLGTAFTRAVVTIRMFTTSLNLGTVFGRSVISARGFASSITLAASGRVDMAMVVLNRIIGGSSTIIKKIFLFDD